MKLAKATVDEFFGIPVTARDDMVQNVADGLGAIVQEYISFLASCGMLTDVTIALEAAACACHRLTCFCLCVCLNSQQTKQAPSRATSLRCLH
jgi:hypothetical protein